MEISTTAAVVILGLVLLALLIFGGCSKMRRDGFDGLRLSLPNYRYARPLADYTFSEKTGAVCLNTVFPGYRIADPSEEEECPGASMVAESC